MEQRGRRGNAKVGYTALIVVLIVLVSVPVYFLDYRASAFNIAPRDDYAPYLLAMTGETGEGPHRQSELFPIAPMAHRPISVAIALPLYYVLPYYSFTNIDEPDAAYLRATAALAFVGWVFMLLTALVVYAIARHRYSGSSAASLVVALLALLLFGFFGLAGVDPMALLLVAVVIYFVDRPIVVVPVVLLAAFANEKVVIITLVFFGARLLEWMARRQSLGNYRYWPQLAASFIAFVAYVVFRRVILPRPGYEGQLDPSTWLDAFVETIELSASLKGLVTNGVPLAVMAILVLIAWLVAPRLPPTHTLFRRVDVLVALALLLTAVFIGTQFTAGRLVLHSFPLYLPVVAVFIDRVLAAEQRAPGLDRARNAQAAQRDTQM